MPTQNDGWTDRAYDFGPDADLNRRVSAVLNEACHVFHHHADGQWQSLYKDRYAGQLVAQIAQHPSLIRKLLALDDRVVSMLTYRAIEMQHQRVDGD